MIFFVWLMILMLQFIQAFPPTAYANVTEITSLQGIIKNIQTRNLEWTAFKADVSLRFITEDTIRATCQGELTYNRLDEKILLQCFGANKQLLFAFKTNDKQFELYLPARNTVFSGSIFELEDSPDIETHLRPLDLYRALKPSAINEKSATLEKWNAGSMILNIFNERRRTPYLARRLLATASGDIPEETFYSLDQQPVVTIFRSNFRKYFVEDGNDHPEIIYPQQILIQSNAKPQRTVLRFHRINFFSALDNPSWSYPVTGEIRHVTIVDENIQRQKDFEKSYI